MQSESISMEISCRLPNELIAAKLMHSIVHRFPIATVLIILKVACGMLESKVGITNKKFSNL